MNLLLLLSALLSALTGVGGGVRAQDRAQAVAEGTIAAAKAAAVERAAPSRPQAVLPSLVSSATHGGDAALTLLPSEPVFATRRRE